MSGKITHDPISLSSESQNFLWKVDPRLIWRNPNASLYRQLSVALHICGFVLNVGGGFSVLSNTFVARPVKINELFESAWPHFQIAPFPQSAEPVESHFHSRGARGFQIFTSRDRIHFPASASATVLFAPVVCAILNRFRKPNQWKLASFMSRPNLHNGPHNKTIVRTFNTNNYLHFLFPFFSSFLTPSHCKHH